MTLGKNMQIITDTNIVIDFLRGDKDTFKLFDLVKNKKIVAIVNQIIIAELYVGVEFNSNPKIALNKLETFLDILKIQNLNLEEFKRSGRILGQLGKKGTWIQTNDAIIAAHSERPEIDYLLTNNKKHFEMIESIRNKVKTLQEFMELIKRL